VSACTIRPYQQGDAEHLHAAVLESVAEVSPWLGWCHPGYSFDEAREWVTAQQDLAKQGLAFSFAIWGDGRYLGGCGINQVNQPNRFANLGYWVRASAMGRGVAPAAARLVAEYAFRETDLVRLEIVCAVGNLRSQRVAEKLGAVREGVLRNRLCLPSGPSDAVMFSLLRSQKWHLRRAVRGDEPILRALRFQALSEAPEAFGSTLDRELARTVADWQRWLTPGATFILDALGGPNGLAAGQLDSADHAAVNLLAMWVHPALRGAGAAEELVAAVIAWGASQHAKTVRLDVFDGNTRARHFYERLGFRETGKRTVHDGRIEVRMERAVHPPGSVTQ
jgi:ribosomal-protein-serine acetyltransferase